jgi:aspartate/methionine/tyrosine aminotransferase
MPWSRRLDNLGANVFAEMDQAKSEALAAGRDLIDLSLGSSDLPTPAPILETVAAALRDPRTHGYLLHRGTLPFRETVARWYERRFGSKVDPETEVLALIGSQEGAAHLPLAILNPGDVALLLDPGYPSHWGGVRLAGGEIYPLPLTEDNQFLPDFAAIPPQILERAKLLILSYPHNPTAAVAPEGFFAEAIDFAQRREIVLIHDFPYLDIVFEPGYSAPSLLAGASNRRGLIEFFTLSKSYNMGGFRVGFAIGDPSLIGALRRLKAMVDFNQYEGILRGAMTALDSAEDWVAPTVETYRQRRDFLVGTLNELGWPTPLPPATLYLWTPLPSGFPPDSQSFCLDLLRQTGVALSPGVGFGAQGEGFARLALVQQEPRLAEAARRLGAFLVSRN